MRNYGESLTQEHLNETETRAVQRSAEMMAHVVSTVSDDIDVKQQKQINELRVLIGLTFVVNLVLILVSRYLL